MRFFYLFSIFMVSGFLFAENTLLQPDLEVKHLDISSYQNRKIGKECTISFITYSQILLTPFPLVGYGASLRLHKNHVGLQLDCNTAKGKSLLGDEDYSQLSIAGIYYPFYTNNDSWLDKCYVSCGISKVRIIYTSTNHWFEKLFEIFGLHTKYSSYIYRKKCFMLGPLSIGYQGKILFFDVGISAVNLRSLFHSTLRETQYGIFESIKIGCSF